MTKRSPKSSSKRSPTSTISGILALIVAVIALFLSQDNSGSDTTVTPTTAARATVTTAPPSATARPATAVPGATTVANASGVTPLTIGQGFGARKGFWEVYFTAPTGSSRSADYVNGIDVPLANALGQAQRTVDIAAFEFNNPVLTRAVLDAKSRGVRIRMVVDDEHGIEDEDTTLGQFEDAGIEIVPDNRSALMHDKFMIIDSSVVWTGSWNYTINDTYRNNNSAMSFRSRRMVENYQREFDEMFTGKKFGPRSTSDTPNPDFSQDGTRIQTFFAAEDQVIPAILTTVQGAERAIRFMAFSFTVDEISQVIEQRAQDGVTVQGIFETTGSETAFSELTTLFCDGLQVRQDGNRFILHHKVFIIDDDTVIVGSFNFSASATNSNDENMVIIEDRDLAAQYIAEFNRRWAESVQPDGLTCS